MDEDFTGFLKEFGPAIDRRFVPPSSIDRFRGKLPDTLLNYWQEYGWCGYANGMFWTVNPDEYEAAMDAWIEDTPLMGHDVFHVIARTAFGDLYLWGERTGASLTLFPTGSYCVLCSDSCPEADLKKAAQYFFGGLWRAATDFDGMFAPALRKLGPLKHDEMYGFVPALALGGSAEIAHLEKVKAVEHLVILAQFAPLDVMTV